MRSRAIFFLIFRKRKSEFLFLLFLIEKRVNCSLLLKEQHPLLSNLNIIIDACLFTGKNSHAIKETAWKLATYVMELFIVPMDPMKQLNSVPKTCY